MTFIFMAERRSKFYDSVITFFINDAVKPHFNRTTNRHNLPTRDRGIFKAPHFNASHYRF